MKNEIVEKYIFNYDNLDEDERKNIYNEIKDSLDNLDLYKVLDFCLKYSDRKYLKGKNSNILDLGKEVINNRLNSLSLIKVIDLYIELFNKTIMVSDSLMASKNILDVMSYNLQDEEFIKREMDKKHVSKEEYVSNLKRDLDKNIGIIDSYQKNYDYLDKLQDDILVYIEGELENIEGQDKYYLIQNLNKRFTDNSLKLLKLQDNLDNIRNIDKNELVNTIEYNNIKNSIIIYESFRNSLLDEKKDDSE